MSWYHRKRRARSSDGRGRRERDIEEAVWPLHVLVEWTELGEQQMYRSIVVSDDPSKVEDAPLARGAYERVGEDASEALVLHLVRDRDGEFGRRRRVAVADEPRNAEPARHCSGNGDRRRNDGDVVGAVRADEEVEHVVGQRANHAVEAVVAR